MRFEGFYYDAGIKSYDAQARQYVLRRPGHRLGAHHNAGCGGAFTDGPYHRVNDSPEAKAKIR